MKKIFTPSIAIWLTTFTLISGRAATAATQDTIAYYPLDSYSRTVSPRGRVRCPALNLVPYRGELVRYAGVVIVHPAFQKRLRLFEQVVVETAKRVYGRAPRRVAHKGGFNCRRIKGYPDYLSEHGLGNAIDISGFDFGPARPGATTREGLPRRLRRGFKVRMLRHWDATGPVGAIHSKFLRLLASRLIERQDIFRVVLGPAWPGHHNHFHFDCAPYRLVEVFDNEQNPTLANSN